MTDLIYDIVISPLSEEDGGGFAALVPDLFGCIADGDTPESAVSAALDAIEAWILVNEKHGREIPAPGDAAAQADAQYNSLLEVLEKQQDLIQEQREFIETLSGQLAHVEKVGVLRAGYQTRDEWTGLEGIGSVTLFERSKPRAKIAG